MQCFNMKRILVIGSPGAGKTVFSRKLAQKTGLPLIHLDALFWEDHWTESTNEVFDAKLDAILCKEHWIIDGNYARTLPRRLAMCDQVVYLDYPRTLCILGVLKRVIQNYGKSRSDIGGNCPERLDFQFLRYVWRFPKDQKPKIMGCLNNAEIPIFTAKNRGEASHFLSNL